MLNRVRNLSCIHLCRQGAAFPVFAIGLGTIVSVVGMTLAIAMDQGSGTQLQASADNAALAGATAFISTASAPVDEHLSRAYQVASDYARANLEEAGDAIVNVGAVTTDVYGQTARIDVVLIGRATNLFARFSAQSSAEGPVVRKATAIATRGFPLCFLALTTTGTGISLSGSGRLDAPACALWSNSDASDSIRISDSATVSASSICAVGTAIGDTPGRVSPEPVDGCQIIPDPLTDWVPPTFGGCDTIGGYTVTDSQITVKLDPGVFCGGLWAVSKRIHLKPGLYVIKDGPLVLDGSDELIAEGVTFLLSGANASVQIKGDGVLRMVAPSDGPLAGIALAEDRTTYKLTLKDILAGVGSKVAPVLTPDSGLESVVTGNGQIHIEGFIYLPRQKMVITGQGWGEKSSPYLQIVAHSLEISELGELAIDFNMGATSVPVVIEPERWARLLN